MRSEDITFALDRIVDLHRVHAGRKDLDDDTTTEIAQRFFEGAGIDSDAIFTLHTGLHILATHDSGIFDYLGEPQVVAGIGFGLLIGAISQERADERQIKQLREALNLIAEPDEKDEMFGLSPEKRIARVALAEADDA